MNAAVSGSHGFQCGQCELCFPSRNGLFRHLEDMDHFADGYERNDDDGQALNGTRRLACNAAFCAYYKVQLGLPADAWSAFLEKFASPLPKTVRMMKSSIYHRHVAASLVGEFLSPSLTGFAEKISAHKILAQSRLIAAAQEIGALHRQELCSMLPAMILKPHPDDIVLDLCAAPGSKTLQLLDAMAGGRGLLIANDISMERCKTIAHRTRNGDRRCLLLTNGDARNFPSIYRRAYKLHYDKILCDVPCSGDGTLRKNRALLRDWNVSRANSLHCLQLKILKRAVQLLRHDGMVLYSTCSINPIENEAVVRSCLLHFGSAVELCVIEDDLLAAFSDGGVHPGLTTWRVARGKTGDFFSGNFDSVPESELKDIRRSMFPDSVPVDVDLEIEKNQVNEQLRRCRRILPCNGNADSGGFFLALLRRKRKEEEERKCGTDTNERAT